MNIVVASGKGGTGKTSVAVNLTAVAAQLHPPAPLYFVDCDVEAPNAAIFLHPTLTSRTPVENKVPHIDENTCTHCGECARACQFHALSVTPQRVLFFPELCHSCGVCSAVCQPGAIYEIPHALGVLESGTSGDVIFMQGEMEIGRASPVAIISQLLVELVERSSNTQEESIAIIDAPPGVSCALVASLQGADMVLLVAEPTPFGFHDFKLTYQLVHGEMNIPVAVILNKDGVGDTQVENFCQVKNIPILQRIPFSRSIAESYARGELLVEHDPRYRKDFEKTWQHILALREEQGVPI
ncbi:MAG TPA: (4Fe-4S)-binding protein [Anaerolineaceae bacterium]|nr:(4Fe-4S)-binding protein [Anaerolineaceae bacterium]